MAVRDIIVIGASAGGVIALKEFVKTLPKDFMGSIFIVMHIPSYTESRLPAILTTSGLLEAIHPQDGQSFKQGKIYVAPHDHHMLLEENNKVVVKKGPKENRFRPSIDALFRSAAYIYKERVVGIILSGYLDDGASGLWTIKKQGGLAIIQHPDDAEQPQLPINVSEYVTADFTVTAREMGPILVGLAKETVVDKFKLSEEELKRLKMEIVIATRDNSFEMGIMDMGHLTPFTCPECNGALIQLVEGQLLRYRCHTGHAYTASSLLAEVSETIETMLWQSMRGLEEMNMLLKKISIHYDELNNSSAAALFRKKAEQGAKKARIIHDSVFRQENFSEDLRFEEDKEI